MVRSSPDPTRCCVYGIVDRDFDDDNEASFAAVLTRISQDAALRERLATRARATIGEMRLTWRGNAQRVVALASGLCDGNASASASASASAAGISSLVTSAAEPPMGRAETP